MLHVPQDEDNGLSSFAQFLTESPHLCRYTLCVAISGTLDGDDYAPFHVCWKDLIAVLSNLPHLAELSLRYLNVYDEDCKCEFVPPPSCFSLSLLQIEGFGEWDYDGIEDLCKLFSLFADIETLEHGYLCYGRDLPEDKIVATLRKYNPRELRVKNFVLQSLGILIPYILVVSPTGGEPILEKVEVQFVTYNMNHIDSFGFSLRVGGAFIRELHLDVPPVIKEHHPNIDEWASLHLEGCINLHTLRVYSQNGRNPQILMPGIQPEPRQRPGDYNSFVIDAITFLPKTSALRTLWFTIIVFDEQLPLFEDPDDWVRLREILDRLSALEVIRFEIKDGSWTRYRRKPRDDLSSLYETELRESLPAYWERGVVEVCDSGWPYSSRPRRGHLPSL